MKIIQIILVIILVVTILGSFETQAQKVTSKSRSSGATPSATPNKSNTATNKQLPQNANSQKITGWAIEVRSISSAFDNYVGFNSTRMSIVMLPIPMNRYSPNVATAGMQCQFDISDKLFRESQAVVARIQPQKWKTGYGDNATIALRVTITFHHKGDEPSTVYETWWKGTREMPDDLRQILQLKDKVADDIKAQCQKEIDKRN
jgi:hypothetical protein